MAEPTIKRLKVKTVRTKPAPSGDMDTDAVTSESTRVTAAPAPRRPSYTVFAILALIAMLGFVALVALQWMEWTYYSPAFPKAIPAGPIGT